jgi:uncharacterized protein (DUF885 family)
MIGYYEKLLPRTLGNHGVWALPDGEALYAFAIRTDDHDGTDAGGDPPPSGWPRWRASVRRWMPSCVREGLADGSIGERIARAARPTRRSSTRIPTAGRAEVIADYQAIIDEIDAGLGASFDVRPVSACKVIRVPEFREGGAGLAYYQPPSLDGARPGDVLHQPARDERSCRASACARSLTTRRSPAIISSWRSRSSSKGLPIFRRMMPLPAYTEGWALYAEQLAWELGFQDDPLDNLGRLQAEMFRAVRLVVDTGLHAQALDPRGGDRVHAGAHRHG